MKNIPDSLTQLKDGISPIARDGEWTKDPAAAWIIADLQKSGIDPNTAASARLAFTSTRSRISDLLNRPYALPSGMCLVIPYFDEAGKPVDYCRLKPEKPRLQKRDGEMRPVKYDAPSDLPSRLYIPPAAVPRLLDVNVDLVLSEGEKKGIALNQFGILAVAVAGVWNLLKKREGIDKGRTFNDYEFRWPPGIPVAGRRIILVFDSDTRTKSNLPLAMKYICQHLEALGATVLVANLPDGPSGEKMGADDFLVANGSAAFQAIIDAAEVPIADKTGEKGKKPRKEKEPSAADVLTAIGALFDLWHDCDDRAFASEGRRTLAVRSKSFKTLLTARYRKDTKGQVPNAEALATAILAIEAIAIHDRPECESNVRVAEFGQRVYVHLANNKDTVIEIDASGWRECETPPIRFLRVKGMRPLPMPKPGGNLEDLRRLINAPEDAAFALIRAWIAQAFRRNGPFPLAVLLGEQGSAKTTTARVLKRLIDPRESEVRSEPKDTRDLMISARTNWVLAFDNLSCLPGWLSDALCRLSTGGAFSTRELYSDDEETTFNAKRPLVLNGIEDFVTRADLLERSLLIEHPSIKREKRRPESKLWAEFDRLAEGLLGAIFDYVAGGMRELPGLELSELPRMADFALFAVACEKARVGNGDKFLAAYLENQAGAHEQVLEDSPVTVILRKFMEVRQDWKGTATDLLKELDKLVEADVKKTKEWPKRANGLSNKLKRLAPSLRRVAQLDVTTGVKDTDKKRTRHIVIRRLTDEQAEGSSASSGPSASADSAPDSPPTAPDDQPIPDLAVIVTTSSDDNANPSRSNASSDAADRADGLSRPNKELPMDAPVTPAGKRKRGKL
jgi:Domain of unknown function (DUF3854)